MSSRCALPDLSDWPTTAALLTAPGRSAIAVIAVDGPQAAPVIEQWFQPAGRKPIASRTIGSVIFGWWQRPGHEAREGVVVRRCGAERWEVHSHGGTAAVGAIMADLTAAGCRARDWQSDGFAQTGEPLAASAAAALAAATTARTASHLLAQQRGALRQALQRIARQIAENQLDRALQGIEQLLDNSRWGLHLTAPWKVVLCGSPNVGKSSLVNALLGYGRAIVFDRAGTTRDVLTAHTAIAGWPVELADTAGLRVSGDPLEAAGVARARAAAAEADLVIPVLDRSAPLIPGDLELLSALKAPLIVANKADLPPRWRDSELAGEATMVTTSAVTRLGIDPLLDAIAAQLVPVQPPIEAATLFRAEQVALVEEAANCCRGAEPVAAIELLTRLMCLEPEQLH